MTNAKKYSILYVDDEENNLLVLRATFRFEYQIHTVTSAKEGLCVLKNHPIDLIITDQKMPEVNGVEFLKQVVPHYPDIIRIILTGYSDLGTVVEAVNECGIYRYMTKPWTEEEMRLTLEKALEMYRLRQENSRLVNTLAEANKELEERVRQRTAELVALNEEKNYLVSLVAHDLRSPLSNVHMLVEVMKMKGQNLTEEQLSYLQLMQQTNEKMMAMIQKILDINAIETGKLNIALESTDLTPLLESSLTEFSEKAIRKNIQIVKDWASREHWALVDRNFFAQSLENLLSNAIKFSPTDRQVFVRLRTDASTIRIEIQDQGQGIHPHEMDKLFGKFQKLSARPTGGESSTGLGLSIVKKYVELMNGRIWCESQWGEGATFVIDLPKAEP